MATEYRVQTRKDGKFEAQYEQSSLPPSHPLYAKTYGFKNISAIKQTVELEANKEIVAFDATLSPYIDTVYKSYNSDNLPPTE